jgi:hypothetical protein
MNPLSKVMKLILCIIAGMIGFVIIPGIWTAWQQSMGFKTPGVIFIMIVWAATVAAIRAIWKHEPEKENNLTDVTNINDKHKLDKS